MEGWREKGREGEMKGGRKVDRSREIIRIKEIEKEKRKERESILFIPFLQLFIF